MSVPAADVTLRFLKSSGQGCTPSSETRRTTTAALHTCPAVNTAPASRAHSGQLLKAKKGSTVAPGPEPATPLPPVSVPSRSMKMSLKGDCHVTRRCVLTQLRPEKRTV